MKDESKDGAAWVEANMARIVERAHAVVADDDGQPRVPFILLLPGHNDGTQMISTLADVDALKIMSQVVTSVTVGKIAEAIASGRFRVIPLGAIGPADDDDDKPEGKVH
jgi:hypothetical protein